MPLPFLPSAKPRNLKFRIANTLTVRLFSLFTVSFNVSSRYFVLLSSSLLELYYKSRHRYALSVTINYTQIRRLLMAANNYNKYDEDFKKSLVSLHQNGKTQTQLCKEYGVSSSALGKWVKQYSTVETDDGEVLTAKQVKELQKRNAQLEEENLILKKAIAIFTPHSGKD